MKKLEPFVGRWAFRQGKVTASVHSEWTEGYRWFKTVTEVGTNPDQKSIETGYTTWDSKTKSYISYSFSSASASPRIERGSFVDGALVSVSEPWEVGGFVARYRGTSKREGEKMTWLVEIEQQGKWNTFMTMTFQPWTVRFDR